MEAADYETMLVKLNAGAVVEIRELDVEWSSDVETRRIIAKTRLAFVLEHARARGGREPRPTHCAIVTVERARTLLGAGATWLGTAAADPRNA